MLIVKVLGNALEHIIRLTRGEEKNPRKKREHIMLLPLATSGAKQRDGLGQLLLLPPSSSEVVTYP